MNRKPYPSDFSDDEWAFVASYLPLMSEGAPQRDHPWHESLMLSGSHKIVKEMKREIFAHFRWHQKRQYPPRAGQPVGQTDCRVQRPVHPHCGIRPPPSQTFQGMAFHQRTRTQLSHLLAGLEVLRSTGPARA